MGGVLSAAALETAPRASSKAPGTTVIEARVDRDCHLETDCDWAGQGFAPQRSIASWEYLSTRGSIDAAVRLD